MDIESLPIEKPDDINFILGQSHFIKTVEDIYEAIVNVNPELKFGLAFCEASMNCLVRFTGNDDEMTELAKTNAKRIGAGHSFIIFMKNGFPINIIPRLKEVPEVCRLFCATANPTDVLIVENDRGRGIVGVIDGSKPKGIEGPEDKEWRRDFLRKIGYKQ